MNGYPTIKPEQKRQIVEGGGYTLNGIPARILGAKANYATVAQIEAPFASFVWSWSTVERIITTKGGRFVAD